MGNEKVKTVKVNSNVSGAIRGMTKLQESLQAVGLDVTKLDHRLRNVAGNVEEFAAVMGKVGALLRGAAVVGAFTTAIQKTREFAHASIEAKGVFDNLPFPIQEATKATRGFVEQLDLAKAANKANALGAAENATEFARLAEVAAKAAKVQGTDQAKAVDDLTTALSRMSPQILDNLGVTLSLGEANRRYAERIGVTVASLTEQQKKTAFQTEAMAELEKKYADVELEANTLAETIVQVEIAWEDFKTSILTTDLTGGVEDATDKIVKLKVAEIQALETTKERHEAMEALYLQLTKTAGGTLAYQRIVDQLAASEREAAAAAESRRLAGEQQFTERLIANHDKILDQKGHELELDKARGLQGKALLEAERTLAEATVTNLRMKASQSAEAEAELKKAERALEILDAKIETFRTKRSGGRGKKAPTLDELISGAISGDHFDAANDGIEAYLAEEEAKKQAEFDLEIEFLDAAFEARQEAREKEAKAMEAAAAREAKIQEERAKAAAKAAEEERKAQLKRAETYVEMSLVVVDATQSQLESLVSAAVRGEEISGKEIKMAARTQSAVLAVQSAMHFARAAAYGIAGSPLAITQALAGAKAAAGAASVLALGEAFGSIGGGGSGGTLASGGAFSGTPEQQPRGNLNDAPVSPLEGDGQIPAQGQASQQQGSVVINVAGSVLSEGDLARAVRDAVRNGVAA